MLELILGILLAAGGVYYVLLPILRPAPASAAAGSSGDDGDDPEEDVSPQAVALRALKEIDFDRATGKLSDVDYESLKTKYSNAAVAALRGDEGRGTGEGATRPATRPPSPVPRPVCPIDGPRPETDAAFCSTCGRRLTSAPGFCARCGTALEADARFCARCGTRSAA